MASMPVSAPKAGGEGGRAVGTWAHGASATGWSAPISARDPAACAASASVPQRQGDRVAETRCELGGRALGDDGAVVDDEDAVGKRVASSM